MSDFDLEGLHKSLGHLIDEGNRKRGGSQRKYINKEEVVGFYPQNLYVDEERLVVHIFQEKDVLTLTSNKQGTFVQIQVLKRSIIKRIDFLQNEESAVLLV